MALKLNETSLIWSEKNYINTEPLQWHPILMMETHI